MSGFARGGIVTPTLLVRLRSGEEVIPIKATGIALGPHVDCILEPSCLSFAAALVEQLGSGRYDYPASILELQDFDVYRAEHRTARKRAARAARLGYEVAEIDRADYEDDVYRINMSMPERQGRPMSSGYTERQTFSPAPFYACARHRIDTFGVLKDGTLVAYLVLYVSGSMAMVSQILGHGDHLANDVMYLLVLGALEAAPKPVTVFYNRHDGGTDGLRFFKERLGFRPERVTWAL